MFDEANKAVSNSDNYQKSYNNDSRSNLQCNFCGKTGHTDDRCYHRINAAAFANYTGSNTANNVMASSGAGYAPWCKYCRAAGHLIGDCVRRMYSEQRKAINANIVTSGQQGSSNDQKGSSNVGIPNEWGKF